MASSTDAIPYRAWSARLGVGLGLAIAIATLVGLLLLVMQQAARPTLPGGIYDLWHLLRMTAIQAGLTTILSIIVGMALAWALDRLRFPGRALLVGLFASALVTPGLVVAAGILGVWGRNGWIAHFLSPFGIELGSVVFGLGGILLAHLVLDGAFAARVLLARLEAVPRNRLKTGQSLALSPLRRVLVIDLPAMVPGLPGLAAVIFMLAFTSFPIVLLLGGGPANQTLEVAIYSAVRLDFDLSTAVFLALVQLGVCALIVLPAAGAVSLALGSGEAQARPWRDGPAATALQIAVLGLGTLGFAAPLLGVLVDGLGPALADLAARPSFWQALGTSLALGILSALTALVAALVLALARVETGNPALRMIIAAPVFAYLAVPGVVLSLGFFLLARRLGIGTGLAAPIVLVIANTLLALPFAFTTLAPRIADIARRHARLCRTLDLGFWRRFALVEWPLLGREAGIVLAIAFCFALGDLGVIALFGTENFSTLPWLMYRSMGAYRTNDAAAIAAILLLLCVAAFTLLPRLVARLADAGA